MSRVALVTGGSRGIGAATCRLLGSRGYDVAVNFLSDAAAAEAIVAAVTAAGQRAIAIQADTGAEAEVVAMFETVDRELGRLDALVNNAGIDGPTGRVDELSAFDIEQVLRTNVTGYVLCAREAVRRMSQRHGGSGGAIVNVSSGSAHIGQPGKQVLYAVSKGAVNSLHVGLSQEVAGEGIRVNTVMPGMTDTEMLSPDQRETAANMIPMGRIGQPEEIAEAIVWLLSNEAAYVAGANIRVAGGRI